MNSQIIAGTALRDWGRALIPALAIGVVWGGWASYVNAGHGYDAQRNAALAQGGISFVVTFFMTILLNFFFVKISRPFARIAAPIFLTMSIVVALTAIVHVVMGTPEIVATLAGPCFAGTLYCFTYILKLMHQEKLRKNDK